VPFTWTLDAERRLVRFVWSTPLTFQEWQAAMSDILAHPSFAPGYGFLVDRRAGVPPRAFVTDMANFIDQHRAALERVRVALVVGDEVGFGMGRMTELATTSRNPSMTVRVFRESAEAEQWLTSGATG
jgi:hypothetical protein